jgi:hypothetical protein
MKLVFLDDISIYNDIFRIRNNLFFKMKYLIINKDERIKQHRERFRQQLKRMNEMMKNPTIKQFKGQAIVTFQNSQMCRYMRKALLKNWLFEFKIFICMMLKSCCYKEYFEGKLNNMKNISSSHAPEPNEIKWENIGISRGKKLSLHWISNIYTVILILVCGTMLFWTIIILKGINFYLNMLGVIIIMVLYSIGINILARKRRGKTFTAKAYFILSRSLFFHLLFTVVIPVVFYSMAPNSKKLRYLFVLICFFASVIIIFYLLDLKHVGH